MHRRFARYRPVYLFLFVFAALAAVCSEPVNSLSINDVDVYGTNAFDAATVRNDFSDELRELSEAIQLRDVSRVQLIKDRIAAEILPLGRFSYVNVSPIRYFPPNSALYVTIDVVEEADKARRMPFRSPPTEVNEDPDGLISAWYDYEKRVGELAAAGQLPQNDHCSVLHCLASFSNLELRPYLERFNTGVARNDKILRRIAERDANPRFRAAAVFLLSHSNNRQATFDLLGRAMFDADSMVRNNAMRVLIGTALNGVVVSYPVDDIISAMDFPATTDRNKAAFLISILAKEERNKKAIISSGVPVLIRLLKLKQPNNHDPAYEALKSLSGESFADSDSEAWQDWARSVVPQTKLE